MPPNPYDTKLSTYDGPPIQTYSRSFPYLTLNASLHITAAGAEDAVSDDWLDYQAAIDGIVYTLPIPVATLLKDGWTMEEAETLKPDQYTLSIRLEKGEERLYAQIINLGIDELPLADCLIGGLTLDHYDAEKGATLTVAGGITLGSPIEDVEAVFGTPGRTYEGSTSSSYTYESDSYSKVEFYYDTETKLVTKISLRNFTAPAGYNDEALAAPVEIPDAVTEYAPPTALGDDILSFNVRIGDALYTVPASYQYMEEQGWKLGQAQEGKVSAWSSRRMVSFLLGGYKMDSALYNASPKATSPEYCFVTTFRLEDTASLDVELPGGITLGMSRAELDAAIATLSQEPEIEEYSSITVYLFKQDILQEVKVVVNLERDSVSTIELTYHP